MNKKPLIVLMSLFLISLLFTSLAFADSTRVVRVAGKELTAKGFWTLQDDGSLREVQESETWNIKYEPVLNRLTLRNTSECPASSSKVFCNISVQDSEQIDFSLMIEGDNTLTGIDPLHIESTAGSVQLLIEGNGSLKVFGYADHLNPPFSPTGIFLHSGTAEAILKIKGSKLTVSTPSDVSTSSGIRLISHDDYLSHLIADKGAQVQSSGNTGLYMAGSDKNAPKITLTDSVISLKGTVNGLESSSTTPINIHGKNSKFVNNNDTVIYGRTFTDTNSQENQGKLTIPKSTNLNLNSKQFTNSGVIQNDGGLGLIETAFINTSTGEIINNDKLIIKGLSFINEGTFLNNGGIAVHGGAHLYLKKALTFSDDFKEPTSFFNDNGTIFLTDGTVEGVLNKLGNAAISLHQDLDPDSDHEIIGLIGATIYPSSIQFLLIDDLDETSKEKGANIQWQRSTDEGKTWTDIKDAVHTSYRLTELHDAAGLYRCVITINHEEVVSSSLQLSVQAQDDSSESGSGATTGGNSVSNGQIKQKQPQSLGTHENKSDTKKQTIKALPQTGETGMVSFLVTLIMGLSLILTGLILVFTTQTLSQQK